MKFPIVIMTRKRYDRLMGSCQFLCKRTIELEDERDRIVGNACVLADNERADRELERSHFEAILTNRGEQ